MERSQQAVRERERARARERERERETVREKDHQLSEREDFANTNTVAAYAERERDTIRQIRAARDLSWHETCASQ